MPNCPRGYRVLRIVSGALFAVMVLLGTAFVPAGPAYAQPDPTDQWRAHEQLAPLGAEEAWQHATGDGVTVAVIDSGVDAGHPDLAGQVLPGRDYVDGSTDARVDGVGHGTTVASLIAGAGDDVVVGLAPEATILPVRVLDDENRYQSASTVADGVRWAVRQGADVINLSLGGDRRSDALSDALEFAMANDVVVVACTGNVTGDEQAQVWYPAREPGVVGVAGLDRAEDGSPTGWSDSLTGPETVLVAPAVVTGAQAGGGHRTVQGTSFSSALVAGTAALIRSRWPELSADDVVNRLVVTAEDLGTPGRDPVYGFGAVDPAAALTETVPPVRTNPLDTKARHGVTGFGPAPDGVAEAATPVPTEALTFELAPGEPAGAGVDERAAGHAPGRPPWWPIIALVAGATALVAAAAAVRRVPG